MPINGVELILDGGDGLEKALPISTFSKRDNNIKNVNFDNASSVNTFDAILMPIFRAHYNDLNTKL